MSKNSGINDLTGSAAVPRKNGELVFDAPWQSRAFGMVVGLHEKGMFHWDEFKDRLIAAVAEPSADDAEASPATVYYRQWLRALEHLLLAKGVVSSSDLASRTEEFSSGTRDEVF
jgi:nitrile hydratase accessory protein